MTRFPLSISFIFMGDCSASIATGYGLDDRGSIFDSDRNSVIFLHSVSTGSRVHTAYNAVDAVVLSVGV